MNPPDLRIAREATTLRALVEDKLRLAIITGLFQPGQKLVERQLCELIGVGRTSIREGLRQLEAEGLITTVAHRGPFVSTIDYEQAEQIYEIRTLLEGFAGQQFAERASAEDMARLVAAVEDLEVAANDPSKVGLLAAKASFYEALMDGCGNTFVRQMLTPIHNRVNLLRATSMMQPGRLPNSLAELREIRDAVLARDGARACAVCRYHVQMAAHAALSYLRAHKPAEALTDNVRADARRGGFERLSLRELRDRNFGDTNFGGTIRISPLRRIRVLHPPPAWRRHRPDLHVRP